MRCMDLPDAALQHRRFVFLWSGSRSLAKPNLPNVLLFPVRVSTLLVLIWTLPEHLSIPITPWKFDLTIRHECLLCSPYALFGVVSAIPLDSPSIAAQCHADI